MKYEIVEREVFLGGTILKRTDSDGSIWWIPLDENNSDYREYLLEMEEN